MKDGGWLKLHRQLENNPVVMKDGDHLATWIYILLKAMYEPRDVVFKGERLTLVPGQFTTGRKKIAKDLKINEYKIERILSCFETEHQIAQQMHNKCRLITVLKWSLYQKPAQRDEQQMHTNKEIKNTERNKNTEPSKEGATKPQTKAGDPFVNESIELMKSILDLEDWADSVASRRRYAFMLKKNRKWTIEQVKQLLIVAKDHPYHSRWCKMSDLYYKGVELIREYRTKSEHVGIVKID